MNWTFDLNSAKKLKFELMIKKKRYTNIINVKLPFTIFLLDYYNNIRYD